MKEQTRIIDKAKKEVAVYKGHALATTYSLLVSLLRNNLEVATGIIYHIFKRLKDIDSEEKATRAIHSINGYLKRQSKTIEDHTTNVMSSSAKVQELIENLQTRLQRKQGQIS